MLSLNKEVSEIKTKKCEMKVVNSKSDQNQKVEVLLNDQQVLSIENLLQVEGGVDNDEDWCIIGQCKSQAQVNCYTGA